jgi:hypothetical protein
MTSGFYIENYMQQNHWILKVADGKNFKNSKFPFWGLKAGKKDIVKNLALKIKEGDILWFLCNKSNDNKIIGMATFSKLLDKRDELLIQIETTSCIEQGWDGSDWEIELHYTNLYNAEKQNIKIDEKLGQFPITNYNNNKDKINEDLENHYNGFKYYGTCISF